MLKCVVMFNNHSATPELIHFTMMWPQCTFLFCLQWERIRLSFIPTSHDSAGGPGKALICSDGNTTPPHFRPYFSTMVRGAFTLRLVLCSSRARNVHQSVLRLAKKHWAPCSFPSVSQHFGFPDKLVWQSETSWNCFSRFYPHLKKKSNTC